MVIKNRRSDFHRPRADTTAGQYPTRYKFQPIPKPPQHQPYQLPLPHQYMQPTPVPKFRKTMSVAGWEKTVRVWSNSHSDIPEPIRLTMILESLKANEGDFDIEHQGAMEDFMEKFKKKFEIPNWRKCVEIHEQFKTFQHKTMKDPRNTSKDGWN